MDWSKLVQQIYVYNCMQNIKRGSAFVFSPNSEESKFLWELLQILDTAAYELE